MLFVSNGYDLGGAVEECLTETQVVQVWSPLACSRLLLFSRFKAIKNISYSNVEDTQTSKHPILPYNWLLFSLI